ncbi:AAA family ATPase [Candidatus Nitrospira neomarina]|uniref:AAA family ATPase n=1 Tax=Candidatus Nitrospira neomarina TaxID=3020899 RepID=A0AA96GN87_9BACT|nr:AAA family ATPase [Candidatus Nitrospira neomarina]WNM63365.1 AAA family ATPase [Candidatus Nitrospira neomarina]
MRLDRLSIPNYRNLRSFEIDFDESQPTTVLLGRNGTGKSNLIEAIVEIFRELELGGTPGFAYTLEYVCRDRAIRIDADPARTNKRLDITVDGKTITQAAFQRELDTYLPNYVFAYYSGWSSRLERHFDRPTRKHYDRILKSPDRELPLRRLFFCRKEYSQLVLLAFILAQAPAARQLLQEYLGIKHFESALFVLKTPWWRGSGAPNKTQQAEGDPRFWYARGAFKGFLGRLWDRALAPIRNNETIERDIRRQGESTERLFLFIKNEAELAALKEPGEDSKTLFGYLESLFLCDLIDEVRVTVERMDGTRVKFVQMSEGEQQLLTVLGLLLFTQNDESLYLLDEPDTHLNPVWTYDFLKLLQDNIRAEKGQLIVATHNPLMIGSLHKNQVRMLAQAEDRITANEPEYDPIGIGVEGLLKSELYGLRSTLAPEVLKNLDRHYALLGKKSKTPDEQNELMALAMELNELGVSRTHPNPYFESFANALARRRSTETKAALSKAEIDSQTQLADEVLEEVLSEEKAGAKGGGA